MRTKKKCVYSKKVDNNNYRNTMPDDDDDSQNIHFPKIRREDKYRLTG